MIARTTDVNLDGAGLHKDNYAIPWGEEGEEKTCSRAHYLLLQVKCVCLLAAEAVLRALTV